MRKNYTFGRPSLVDVEPFNIDFNYEQNLSSDIVKLDANEGYYLHSAETLAHIDPTLPVHRYPDPQSRLLVEKLSEINGIPSEAILTGNGSDELINNLMVCFFGQKLMLPDISYPVYRHLANVYEMQVLSISLDKNLFDLPEDIFDQFSEVCPNLVLFSYPNNPTGNFFNSKKIERLVRSNPDTVFVIDEAYNEYSGKSLIHLALETHNTVVLRTLSKAYGLAGLRLGYAVAGPVILDMLRKVKLPYNINLLSQHIGVVLIDNARINIDAHVREIIKERAFVKEYLAKIPTLNVFQSETNFLFVRLPANIDLQRITKQLSLRSIYLKFYDFGKTGKFLRLTIGSHDQNIRALRAFEEELCAQNLHKITLNKAGAA